MLSMPHQQCMCMLLAPAPSAFERAEVKVHSSRSCYAKLAVRQRNCMLRPYMSTPVLMEGEHQTEKACWHDKRSSRLALALRDF